MRQIGKDLLGLNWRTPWHWSPILQHAVFLCVAMLGVLVLSPWWLDRWQDWLDANEAHDQRLLQKSATQTLRDQTEALLSQPIQVVFADATVLTPLAHQHGLQVSHFSFDKAVQSPELKTLDMQQLPVQLRLSGTWADWLSWVRQFPISMPGAIVSSLDLQSDAQDGVLVHLEVWVPQSARGSAALHAGHSNETVAIDPFNAQNWVQTQKTYAQQHPSYVQWVVPQLLRQREPLESFPLERLQYVGQVALGGEPEALVSVLPLAATKKAASMASVHRVRVGGHLGQNFGRVQRIEVTHVVLQELVLMPTGEWQFRDVNLPLKESGV